MREAMFVAGFNLAVTCAFGRVLGVLVGAVRSLAHRRRFEVVRFGAVEAITLLEPPVLAVTAFILLSNRANSKAVSWWEASAATLGGLVSLAGLALCVWTLVSWRQLFVGHGVLGRQELVTDRAYAVVRHPVYLGALLIWFGLSLCFLSPVAAALACLYVLPAYLLYVRSEERMMLEVFGQQYRCYSERVPALIPSPRPKRP